VTALPTPERFTFNCSADGSRWPYLLQQPEGKPQAILINLHGHYSDEWQGMTEEIYGDAFGRLRRECLNRSCVYVCPWYGGNSWMGPVAEAGMVDLIAALRQRWPDQPLYLMGGSMGGSSTLVFAVRQPQLLSGVAALCPAADIEAYYVWCLERTEGNPTVKSVSDAIRLHYTAAGHDLTSQLHERSALRNAERLTMPVYLRHGSADGLIPVEWTRRLAERLQGLARRVVYEEVPDGDHDAPIYGLDWGEVLRWLAGGVELHSEQSDR
jgi:pimeloyl-ACP methyl ester carboxylesterase